MPAYFLNAGALALLGAMAVAFSRRCTFVVVACGVLFVPIATGAVLVSWWPVSPTAAVGLTALLMGLPLLGLAAYALDRACACFTIEMTYATLLCWLLWPVLVLAGYVGMLVSA
jgi:hypothetical protein